jgi:hypothetical protein
MSLQDTATKILLLLAKMRESSNSRGEVDGATLAQITNLPPHDINDAVALLERSGYVEWIRYLGTAPYDFGQVWITPVGRYEAERVASVVADPLDLTQEQPKDQSSAGGNLSLPPTPIGSPYGFNDEDWEVIAQRKGRSEALIVVMGYQFQSSHYDSTALKENVQGMFRNAVERYNALPGSLGATLDFGPLAAGYGEHLFNEIARDIISSDIAVFDTSDLNPNVMLELGVALTWGVRVLPIKLHTQPKPPSDISGQTWADYAENASRFTDPAHEEKLVRMVERAMRKKGRNQ